MKKIICRVCIVAVAMMMLCGCNVNVPELTDEQTILITEYATNLLVKHSEISDRDLLSDKELEVASQKENEEKERQIREAEIAEAYKNAEVERVEGFEEEGDDGNSSSEPMTDIPSMPIATFLEEDNFSIEYASCEICESYPNQEEDGIYMAMDATPGHQLCVVKFNVQNITSSEQSLDMLGKGGRYTLQTNDGEKYFSQSTMLLDDLSAYRGTVLADGNQQMVLVFEVDEEISQADLRSVTMRTESGENVILLNE